MKLDSYFDARTCYEDGLELNADAELEPVFLERIAAANRLLAERNLYEAECAYSRGDSGRAIDHLELVKTLTSDSSILEKADMLLRDYVRDDSSEGEQIARSSSCNSCAGSSEGSDCADSADSEHLLPLLEYYELLLQQLPADQCQRYTGLGEDFASAYVAASRDEHLEALSALENCSGRVPEDILSCEKGKILHRLGRDDEAERQLRAAIELDDTNSLAWLTLALVLLEGGRFKDAGATVELMVSKQIMPGQALLLRAEISEATGDHEGAVNQYVELLQTPFARAAAEKLYEVLLETGRHADAAVIFKKYLNKSCH